MLLHVFYFSFRWGPFVHSLGIVQWNPTRRDHPGNPGGVSGSSPVSLHTASSWLVAAGSFLICVSAWDSNTFMGTLLIWVLYIFRIFSFSGSLYFFG